MDLSESNFDLKAMAEEGLRSSECLSFSERMRKNQTVILAEGYLFELERRGYLKAGTFCPEVVVKHPEVVRELHREFAHAGSDVVQALTYYSNPKKLVMANASFTFEEINRSALRIAREVANETNTLMCGDLANTTQFHPDDPNTHDDVRDAFKQQVTWAVEEGADFIVAETFGMYGEAKLALEAIRHYGHGEPPNTKPVMMM